MLQKKLSESTVKPPLQDGIKKITLALEGETKKATVVDTGLLHSRITRQIAPTSGKVGTNVRYASFVEYGTKYMEARHMEGSRKVFGKGMFGYGLAQIKDKMSEFLKSIGQAIETRFG